MGTGDAIAPSGSRVLADPHAISVFAQSSAAIADNLASITATGAQGGTDLRSALGEAGVSLLGEGQSFHSAHQDIAAQFMGFLADAVTGTRTLAAGAETIATGLTASDHRDAARLRGLNAEAVAAGTALTLPGVAATTSTTPLSAETVKGLFAAQGGPSVGAASTPAQPTPPTSTPPTSAQHTTPAQASAGLSGVVATAHPSVVDGPSGFIGPLAPNVLRSGSTAMVLTPTTAATIDPVRHTGSTLTTKTTDGKAIVLPADDPAPRASSAKPAAADDPTTDDTTGTAACQPAATEPSAGGGQ